jgi:hypothetical protein
MKEDKPKTRKDVKKKVTETKSNAGRRTKYNPTTFPKIAEQKAKEQYSNDQICEFLGIHKSSFYDYIDQYTEFSDAIKRGREPQVEKIEAPFYKSIQGYEYEEETIVYVPSDLNPDKEVIRERRVVRKHQPPNATLTIFALKNLAPEKYADKKQLDVNVAKVPDMTPEQAKEISEELDELC